MAIVWCISVAAGALASAVVFVSAGCSLAPHQDRTHFIILASAVPPGKMRDEQRSGPEAIGLGPVQMPEYLDRPELILRTSPNGFELSEIDRWAEPLADNFRHVLTNDLTALLPGSNIVQYPWYPGTRLDYTIGIQVQRFEADTASRKAVLAARWELKGSQGGQPLLIRDVQLSQPLSSLVGDTVAAALSQNVASLALQIVGGLDDLEQQRLARSQH